MSGLDTVKGIFTRPTSKNTDKFSLNGFTSEMNKSGVARPAYFMVVITPPSKLISGDSKIAALSQGLRLRVEQAELPTRSILFYDQRYYGPRRSIPYVYNAQPLTMSVILSEDYREREFFLRWQDMMLGVSRGPNSQNVPGLFDVGYYDNATKDAKVEVQAFATSPVAQGSSPSAPNLLGELQGIAEAVGFNPSTISDPFGLNIFGGQKERQIDASLKVSLVEPFPFDINAIPMNWSDDGYARLQIQFQYRYFTEEHRTFQDPGEDASIARMVREGVQAFNRFKPVLSLIKGQGLGGALRSEVNQVTGGFRAAATAQTKIVPF